MQLRFYKPEIVCARWIPNDPLGAAGLAGVEAYYLSLWSHPALLSLCGFFDFSRKNPTANGGQTIHIVPLFGQGATEWSTSDVRPGDRVFFDGSVPLFFLENRAYSIPEYHTIISLKERLKTPFEDFLIPENLPLNIWKDVPQDWTGVGDREGIPFYLFCRDIFLSPVNSGYVDFLLRRDKGRTAWNWRYFLAESLAQWLSGRTIGADFPIEETSLKQDSRDAFSAFGFHRWVVLKTAERMHAEVDLSDAEARVLEAAREHQSENLGGVRDLLQEAFDELKASLDALTGTSRRYFAEAHHGGMLQEDIGFFEHDWPQMVCDTLREYLSFEGSVVSLDMPANLFRHYQSRFPLFFQQLLRWIEEGRLEILNGMLGQPYSDAHSLENLLSQFLHGLRELETVTGGRPSIFASEEYDLGPAMPQILKAVGLTKAVHAVRLGGASKANSPGIRLWRGVGGAAVEALEHPDLGQPGLSTSFFLSLPEKFARSSSLRREILPLFNIPDFGWNILFRDEFFTGLRFGGTLFHMVTFEDLFRLLPRLNEEVQGDWEDTYHTLFNQYVIRGNMRRYFERLRDFEVLLIPGELRAVLAREDIDFKGAWADYLLGSSHDYTLVGAGFNGWYGASTKANYSGPLQITFSRKLEDVMSDRLQNWSQKLGESMTIDPEGSYLTNPHGFPMPVSNGENGADRSELAPFASLPRDVLAGRGGPVVSEKKGVLDNGRLRCEIDPESGTIFALSWQGRIIWTGNRTGVVLPEDRLWATDGELLEPIPVAEGLSITHRGRLASGKGTLGWVETTYVLRPDSDDLLVEILLCPGVLPAKANYDWKSEWDGSFRYALPHRSDSSEVWVCQANALFKARPGDRQSGLLGAMVPDANAHVMSPEVLGYSSTENCPVWYYNAGLPCYLVYENRIEQFVRMPGEEHLRLRFGVGVGNNAYSPVQRSRMLFYPPLYTREPMPPLPLVWDNPRIGFLRVELLAGSENCKFWFFNYSDCEENFSLRSRGGKPMSMINENVRQISGSQVWTASAHAIFFVEMDLGPTGYADSRIALKAVESLCSFQSH